MLHGGASASNTQIHPRAAGVHSAKAPFSQADKTEFQVMPAIALARRLPATMGSTEHR